MVDLVRDAVERLAEIRPIVLDTGNAETRIGYISYEAPFQLN